MINREKFAVQIDEMRMIASRYESEEFQRIITEIQSKKNCFNVNVLFVGHFSAGKSALLNKLLDRDDFLKEDQLAQTAIATELYYGQEKLVAVSQEGNKKDISSWHKVDNSKDSYVEAYLEAENLKKISDFTVVDTPGFDSGIDSHNKALASYLGTGSAYIFVIDAEKGGIDNISLPFLRELGEYSSQVAILINKCDKQIASNIERIKESAENTLAMHGLDYPVYCVSKFDEGIGCKIVDIINRFSAQMAFDYQMENAIVNGATVMINAITILQDKMFLDTYELTDAIHNYESMEESLRNTFDVKRSQAIDEYENAADNIMGEVEASLIGKADVVAEAVQNGGTAAVNAIVLEAVRPVLINSFKSLAISQVDDLVASIDLSIFNSPEEKDSLDNIVESVSDKLKEIIQNGNFEKISEIFTDTNGDDKEGGKDKKGDGNNIYHLLTGIITLIDGVVCPPELIIVLLPEIIKLCKSLFGESERTKIKKMYTASIVPQVMAKLRTPVSTAVSESQKTMIEVMEKTLNEKLCMVKNELENLKKQKEQKVFDFEELKKMYKDDIAKLQIYTTIGEE